MQYVLAIIITVVVFVVEHFLSILKHWAFGGILPLAFLLFSVWCFYSGKLLLNIQSLFPFRILFLLLLSSWFNARQSRKKKLHKEIEKMKAHDLNN